MGAAVPDGGCFSALVWTGEMDSCGTPRRERQTFDPSSWALLHTRSGQPNLRVCAVGSGFIVDSARGLLFTDEHVRSYCQWLLDRARDGGLGGGRLLAAPYAGEGATIAWSAAWECEALAYTQDWNPTNLPPLRVPAAPDPRVAPMSDPALSVTERYADAALLRATHLPRPCTLTFHGLAHSPSTALHTHLPRPSIRYADAAVLHASRLVSSGAPFEHASLALELEGGAVGETLWSLGLPHSGGSTPTPCVGQHLGYDKDEHGEWIKFDGLIMPGASGGPVVNRRGGVVAWNVRNFGDAPETTRGLAHLRHVSAAQACIRAALAEWASRQVKARRVRRALGAWAHERRAKAARATPLTQISSSSPTPPSSSDASV